MTHVESKNSNKKTNNDPLLQMMCLLVITVLENGILHTVNRSSNKMCADAVFSPVFPYLI